MTRINEHLISLLAQLDTLVTTARVRDEKGSQGIEAGGAALAAAVIAGALLGGAGVAANAVCSALERAASAMN